MTVKKLCENLSHVIKVISTVFMWLGVIAVAFIAVISSVDSVGRYIFGSALRGASVYVEFAMAVFVYGALAMAIRLRKCVAVPVFLERMKPRLRLFFVGIGNLLCCAVSVLIITQLAQSTANHMGNLRYTSEIVHIPYGPFYLFSLIGMCLVTLELIIITVADLYKGITFEEVSASERLESEAPAVEDAAVLSEEATESVVLNHTQEECDEK